MDPDSQVKIRREREGGGGRERALRTQEYSLRSITQPTQLSWPVLGGPESATLSN